MAIKQEQGVEGLPETPGDQNDSFCSGTFVDSTTFPGVEQVSTLVASSIFEAHQRTCLLTIEQIQEQWEQGIEQSKVEDFMRMVTYLQLVTAPVLTLILCSPARICGARPQTN